jgi:glutamyl-tRNA synthetase
MATPVVTRFAPSPTGYLHIGGARTALFNWAFSRHTGGKMLLRIEDTDRERSTEGAVQAIFDGLKWLGLDWDGEPFMQFSRAARHAEVAHELLSRGQAYYCYCSPEELAEMRETARANGQPPRYNGYWRDRDPSEAPAGVAPVIRIKAPQSGEIRVQDHVQGEVVFKAENLDDFIILRSDGTPTYMLAVVVDDHDMGITHIIRGDDHLTNAARQIVIYNGMGWHVPEMSHIPLIHGPDGAKLSKRHGAVSVLEYQEQGYLPDALLNYLVRLGWSHGDQEFFTRAEMVAAFDVRDINKSASALNPDKMLWLNQQHLVRSEPRDVVPHLQWHLKRLGIESTDPSLLEGIVVSQRERSKTLKEMAENSRFFFGDEVTLDARAAAKHLTPDARALLVEFSQRLGALAEWTAPAIHGALEGFAQEKSLGLGKIAQPIRVAVSGGTVSPPIDATLALLGKQRTLARLSRASVA